MQLFIASSFENLGEKSYPKGSPMQQPKWTIFSGTLPKFCDIQFFWAQKTVILGCPWITSQLASGWMTCVEMTFWQGFGAMYNVVTNNLVYLCHESNLILWSLSRFSTNLTVNTFLQSCMLGAITLHGSWGKVWIIIRPNLAFSLFKANSHIQFHTIWCSHSGSTISLIGI
jgi:hypothetical protein